MFRVQGYALKETRHLGALEEEAYGLLLVVSRHEARQSRQGILLPQPRAVFFEEI